MDDTSTPEATRVCELLDLVISRQHLDSFRMLELIIAL